MPHTSRLVCAPPNGLRPQVRRRSHGRAALHGMAVRPRCQMCTVNKLISLTEAERACRCLRPLVFTNGVFDILHLGHVTYLEAARKLGAALVVAVNSDASARGLGKGPERPLNSETDRALLVAA